MCELSRKPMVICSEVIETVSLSGYTKLSSDGNYNTSKTVLTKYKNQSPKKGREYVPHYVGGSGQPVYPVTENYARIELMKHKPWSSANDLPPLTNVIDEFERFIENPRCPLTVRLSYQRAKLKYTQRLRGQKEAVSEDQKVSNPTSILVDKDTLDTLAVASNIGDVTDTIENIENSEIHSGKNYDWGKRLYEVRINLYILFSFCFLKLTFGYFFTIIENLTLYFFFLFLLDANRRGSMANKRDKCLQ